MTLIWILLLVFFVGEIISYIKLIQHGRSHNWSLLAMVLTVLGGGTAILFYTGLVAVMIYGIGVLLVNGGWILFILELIMITAMFLPIATIVMIIQKMADKRKDKVNEKKN